MKIIVGERQKFIKNSNSNRRRGGDRHRASRRAMSVFPTIPIDYLSLKALCREGLRNGESRNQWWPLLPQLSKDTVLTEYPDVSEMSRRLISLVDVEFNEFSSESKVTVLLHALCKVKSVNEPRLIESLMSVIVEVISNIEICFMLGCDMLEASDKYIAPTLLEHESKIFTFNELLRRFMPKTFAALDQIGGLEPKFLNLMFVGFFKKLLPRSTLLVMFDAFLLEGNRILFRYGLALLRSYKSKIKERRFKTGADFWSMVIEQQRSKDTEVTVPIEVVVTYSYDMDRSGFQRLLRPMNISTATFQKLKAQCEGSPRKIKSKLLAQFAEDEGGKTEGTSEIAQESISKKAKTLSLSSTVFDAEVVDPALARDLASKSDILGEHEAAQLLSMLPRRVTCDGLEVAFSTARHGWDLSSLYHETVGMFPCVLVVRTLPPFELRLPIRRPSDAGAGDAVKSKDVVNREIVCGAFLSGALSPPSNAVRGDGASFVYRLCSEDSDASEGGGDPYLKFSWVGSLPGMKERAGVNSEGPKSTNLADIFNMSAASTQQFAVCATTYLSFGASSSQSCNALRIDDELRSLHSGESDTYGNPCLFDSDVCRRRLELLRSPEGAIASDELKITESRQAEIKLIEVLCGRLTYESAMRKREKFG